MKERIIELARKRAEIALKADRFKMVNTYGMDHAARVSLDAAWMLANDAYVKACNDYDAAIADLSAEQLSEISEHAVTGGGTLTPAGRER